MRNKKIQVVLLVETDEVAKTDDPYYTWILRNFFPDYVYPNPPDHLKIIYQFIHLGGCGNYKKKSVEQSVHSFVSSFPKGDTYIVICMDYDDAGKETKERIEEVKAYCESKGYRLSIAFPEIEPVLKQDRNGRSKADAVRTFQKKYPKKESIDPKDIFSNWDDVPLKRGRTNFGKVIQEIVGEVGMG